jgi:hypothetical protein
VPEPVLDNLPNGLLSEDTGSVVAIQQGLDASALPRKLFPLGRDIRYRGCR